ncbi:MAG: hypothetical protein K2Y09_02130 [Nitrosomonas sp.]|jgi:hypothetical protein|uniref:hypothetical protein n=1 Tax=Nitrosomonas sp. TaxID=42353 RepID=UPI001DCC70DE|nr:hypothetical protein [Nitrosomonas sp.]MBX9893966.1 hypothetical protein [Nitrosomonas sp.]
MLTLSIRNQIAIGLLLAALMIATRSHHFATVHNLADASWAIFFLAGFYLRSVRVLPGFFALGWGLDFAATTWGGISDFCMTPAYLFMLPAYASLWLAGRWLAKHYHFSWNTVIPLSISASAGLILCELFSAGGFYFFSGRIAETSFAEFGEQLLKYFPMYIETFVFYTAIAIVIHVLFTVVHQLNSRNTTTG